MIHEGLCPLCEVFFPGLPHLNLRTEGWENSSPIDACMDEVTSTLFRPEQCPVSARHTMLSARIGAQISYRRGAKFGIYWQVSPNVH